MADVPVWSVFAFMDGHDDRNLDEYRRGVPEWRLQDVVRWATTRGYENIYLSRDPTDTAVFRRAGSVPGVKHSMG